MGFLAFYIKSNFVLATWSHLMAIFLSHFLFSYFNKSNAYSNKINCFLFPTSQNIHPCSDHSMNLYSSSLNVSQFHSGVQRSLVPCVDEAQGFYGQGDPGGESLGTPSQTSGWSFKEQVTRGAATLHRVNLSCSWCTGQSVMFLMYDPYFCPTPKGATWVWGFFGGCFCFCFLRHCCEWGHMGEQKL